MSALSSLPRRALGRERRRPARRGGASLPKLGRGPPRAARRALSTSARRPSPRLACRPPSAASPHRRVPKCWRRSNLSGAWGRPARGFPRACPGCARGSPCRVAARTQQRNTRPHTKRHGLSATGLRNRSRDTAAHRDRVSDGGHWCDRSRVAGGQGSLRRRQSGDGQCRD